MVEHRRDRAAVLALEPVEQRQPLLDLVQAAGRRLDALGVAVQLVQQVLGLERQRADARGQRVQLRVHAAGRLQRLRRRGERQRGAAAVLLVAGERARRRPRPPRAAPRRGAGGSRSASSARLLLLARLGAVDLRELPLEQVQLAVARAGALAQLVQARAQAPARGA